MKRDLRRIIVKLLENILQGGQEALQFIEVRTESDLQIQGDD